MLAAGVVATGLSSPPPSPAVPAPTPTATRAPVVYRPGPLEYLDVALVCEPRTDGRRSLTVSFDLATQGSSQVRVLEVAPLLPLRGLTPSGPVTSGGTCERPGASRAPKTIPIRGARIYTMTFRLPRGCPKPYPVRATYRIDVNGQVMTAEFPVLPDLGMLNFRAC